MVGWITGGAIRAEFVRSLLSLQARDHTHWSRGGIMDQISPYIDENRNLLVKTFLDETYANWLFMVDIDMAFRPSLLDDLYPCVERGEKIISGIYNQYRVDTGTLQPLS